MNLIEAERLVRKLTDVLQNHASEAQARPLAQAYAELCRTVNHRLGQCAVMLAQGDEHQALQLAEATPPVLELASRLAFREAEAWWDFCRKHDLPSPEALEGRFIRQLNAAYGQGLHAEHDLYRAYRQSVLLHQDAEAVKALRSIVWRNPSDTNAPRELERLEHKIIRGRLEKLEAALRAHDDAGAARLVEEIEALDFRARPDGEVWQRGQAARCRVLLGQARQCRTDHRWAAATVLLAEVRALCGEHQLGLGAEEAQTRDELERWAADCHKRQTEQERFQRALVELRQLLARGEEQQMAGELPGRGELREQLEALRHKWREIELTDRSVGEDLAARVHKLTRLHETRLRRLEQRRRNLVVAGVALCAIIAIAASVTFWGQRKAQDTVAELKSLQADRQVVAAEKKLAQLRDEETRLAASAPVRAALAATEEFTRQERQRVKEVEAALGRLQSSAEQGFTNLAPDQIQAQFDSAQRGLEATAKDFHEELRAKAAPLVNRWDFWLDTRRNELSAAGRRWLKQAGEIATQDLRYDRGPEAVRAGLTALAAPFRELESLSAPSVPRLVPPADLLAEFRSLQQRAQTCAAELEKWEQVQSVWRNPSSLEAYLDSLKIFQRSEFADPAWARAAGEVSALNISESALLAALLLPNQPEAWAAFQADPALRLQPDEVMPAERIKFRELRDDDHIHNVRAFQRTLVAAPAQDPDRVRKVFLRGDWENTRSALKRGMIYDPKDSPEALVFRRQEFISNVQFEELGRIAESSAFELAGLKQLFDSSGANYGGALLNILDQINREEKSSPLFRAWLALRLLELLELRPVSWGAAWSSAVIADWQRLRELGVGDLRSGDWLVPTRQREWEGRLEEYFKATRSVSYVAQARFLHALACRASEAGFALVGHVASDGKPPLGAAPPDGLELWGWAANPRVPSLLFRYHSTEKRFAAVSAPLPFSPLLIFRGDRRQLPTKVRESLGTRASDAGAYLPPLFALAHE